MNVLVRSIGLIRQALGSADIQMAVPEGTTIPGLLRLLAEERGEKFAPFAAQPGDPTSVAPLRVVVNGRDIAPGPRRSFVLSEGDDVLLLFPIAGG